jgi:Family of unknown function (DUF5752)
MAAPRRVARPSPAPAPFAVKDCALVQLATGLRAQNVRELRDRLLTVPAACVDYHFWGGLLRPHFDDPEYANDFAIWARHGLHDYRLAEQLGVIDPTKTGDVEALREELVDVIERRIDEGEYLTWARPDRQFQFIRSTLVVFDTGRRIPHPRDLPAAIAAMSVGSIFYHFMDARRRPPLRTDDFRSWLRHHGPAFDAASDALANIDPFFTTLVELRDELQRAVSAPRPIP